jgi:hypothetical protein
MVIANDVIIWGWIQWWQGFGIIDIRYKCNKIYNLIIKYN